MKHVQPVCHSLLVAHNLLEDVLVLCPGLVEAALSLRQVYSKLIPCRLHSSELVFDDRLSLGSIFILEDACLYDRLCLQECLVLHSCSKFGT
jgi:hypothetical protein